MFIVPLSVKLFPSPQTILLLTILAPFLAVADIVTCAFEKYFTNLLLEPVKATVVLFESIIVAPTVGLFVSSFTETLKVVVLLPIKVEPL